MVKIRLMRRGARKQPSYRVVVTDSHSPRNGRFIETLGDFNPMIKPERVFIKQDRALHWLKNGALPTEAAARLLAKLGITQTSQEPKVEAQEPDKETT